MDEQYEDEALGALIDRAQTLRFTMEEIVSGYLRLWREFGDLEQENERLKAERDEYRRLADQWRDDWTAAMDYRDALAAHVERLCEHIRNDDELLPVKWAIRAHKLMDSTPTASFDRHKDQWRAEDAFAKWLEEELKHDQLYINFSALLKRYRRQAEEPTE